MAGTLFVVATPIGNLEDITVRALRILREVALIAAEDTRRTAHLLARHAITTPTTSLHEHNESTKSAVACRAAPARRQRCPGFGCRNAYRVRPGRRAHPRCDRGRHPRRADSGPSAVLAVLVASGLPTETFAFMGFPPTRSKDKTEWFDRLRSLGGTVVFFEAPHRIRGTLVELQQAVGDCPVAVGRELTKLHEELVRGHISDVLQSLKIDKGEFAVAVSIGLTTESADRQRPTAITVATELGEMTVTKGMTKRKAINAVARRHGMAPNEIYELAEEAKKSGA
jgi:16S rRNA (cytidine1402-2'-O)-methyltransferase